MGGSSATIGYWYKLAYHHGLCKGPIDAFLEYRGGKKVAWSGALTASGTININEPQLWGGEKDQGGIVGPLNVMFGEAGQMPNTYLQGVFGNQAAAWRGMTTVAFEGGKYGAMNPYPQQPSYKVRSITKQWDDGVCWYEAKAVVLVGSSEETETLLSADVALDANTSSPTGDGGGYDFILPANSTLVVKLGPSSDAWSFTPSDDYNLSEFPRTWSHRFGIRNMDSGAVVSIEWLDAYLTPALAHAAHAGGSMEVTTTDAGNYRFFLYDATVDDNRGVGSYRISFRAAGLRIAMNPAHMLVYSRTQRDTGREPVETINDTSAKAAADWFYSQGFGLCTARRPEAESPAEFRRRIEKVSACSFTRSLADGLFYIDIANGVYDLASLPILTDDDVLDFKEIPTVLDNAINSVSVKYFDPDRKESIITPPVRALGLIAEFGVIHQTYDYPEISTAALAVRVAHRELDASTTPTRAFDLATTRKPYGWRQNTYFRAQLPKRGIADMVCLVGDLQHGTLKSGAIKLAAVQDVYSLPSTVYTEVEYGVDTRPDQTPKPIIVQQSIEAPYVDVVALLSRADLDALPPDVGFLAGVAADPGESIGFEMYVAPSGGAYFDAAGGDFCPTAVVTDAANKTTEVFAISDGVRLSEVVVGAPVLWDDEICVVKALAGGSITLGRGCADTVPALHAAASRLLFYGDDAAADRTEYTDGETVDVKLLTNTGSRRLDIALATPMAVTFDQRLVRPYPPGDLRITDDITTSASYPTSCAGALTPGWVHRDRLLQANQLVDASMASIGPEPGTTYTVRYYLDGVLDNTETGITGTAATPYTMSGNGLVRVEVRAMRASIASWQAATAEFNYTTSPLDTYVDENGDTYVDENGDIYGG